MLGSLLGSRMAQIDCSTWLLACLGSKTKTFSCAWQGYSYKLRHPMGVVCDPVPSIYDLTKLCQKFLVLLLSFSRMSQAIKEPI